MNEKKGFEVNGFVNEIECMICTKPKACYLTSCQAGTMTGPICNLCFTAQCRVRFNTKKSAPANGSMVPETHG